MVIRSIEEIIIHNFQSHEHSVITLKNGIIIIAGDSDMGKTAIVRAIMWCLYNKKPNTSFIKFGHESEGAYVQIRFSDGLIVLREESPKRNGYLLTFPDGKELPLEDIGQGPSEAVINAHKMRVMTSFNKTKNYPNVCEQLSGSYFLTQGPTEKAISIGRVAKAEVLDAIIKDVYSESKDENKALKDYKKQLKEVKAEFKELKGLGKKEKALEKSKELYEATVQIQNKIDRVNEINIMLKKLSERKASIEYVLALETNVEACDVLMKEIDEITNNIKAIREISDSINNNIKKRDAAKRIIDSVSEEQIIEMEKLADETLSITTRIEQIKNISRDIENQKIRAKSLEHNASINLDEINDALKLLDEVIELNTFIKNVTKINDDLSLQREREVKGKRIIDSLDNEIRDMSTQYVDILLRDKVCPFCLSPTDEKHLEEHIGDLAL